MYWSRDKQKCNGRAIVYQLKQRVFMFFDEKRANGLTKRNIFAFLGIMAIESRVLNVLVDG